MQGGQGGCAGEGASPASVLPSRGTHQAITASGLKLVAWCNSEQCYFFLMARLREELGRLSSLGVRVGAGGDSARYTLRWGGEVAHDGNCLFEAVAAALGTGKPAASVRVNEHSAERICSKMCLWCWGLDWPRAMQQRVECCAVSSGLPAVQVRARCVAQFLALREAGALPPDIDQTIRNLYWYAPRASCSVGRCM